MDRIYNQHGQIVWHGSLGSVASTSSSIANLANSATALSNKVKGSSDKMRANDLGKATSSIADTAENLASIASYIPGVGPIVSGVLGAVASVCSLIGSIFGSDEDEAIKEEATQWVSRNNEIEMQNFLLDQRANALKISIENALPYLQQYTQTNLNGLMGLGAISATAQLNSAKSLNEYLKSEQVRKIQAIDELIKSFSKVADSLASRNKYLANLKNVQQYSSYASGAAALTGLTIGIIKIAKGESKNGAIYAGSGVLAASLAYYLYRQSKINDQSVQSGSQALQQYSSIINASNTARFPTKELLLKAFDTTVVDKDERAAVNGSYDANTGSWRRGDFSFQIIGTEPIRWKQSKGSEVYYNESKVFLSKMLSGFNLLK